VPLCMKIQILYHPVWFVPSKKKQNSTRYVDRVISAQKREARRPSRRLVPDELDTVFDDDDNADDADDADVNNAHDNDESERMGA